MQRKWIVITRFCLTLALCGLLATIVEAKAGICAEQLLEPNPESVEPLSLNPSLFSELGTIEPDHVVINRVHGTLQDPSSVNRWVVGESVLAWQELDGSTRASRGAFVFYLDPADVFLSGIYFGEEPEGLPPANRDHCRDICDSLNNGQVRQFAANYIQNSEDRLFVAGWTLPSWSEAGLWTTDGDPLVDRDAWVVELVPDLSAPLWTYAPTELGDAEVLSMLAMPEERLLITGYSGLEHSTFLALMDVSGPAGVVIRQANANAAWDDEGHLILPMGDGWQLEGSFTRRLQLEDEILESSSDEPRGFKATYGPDLDLLSASIVPQSNLPCVQADPVSDDPEGSNPFPNGGVEITQLRYLVGDWGSGGVAQIKASDNCYLHMYEDSSETSSGISIFARLALHPPIDVLSSVALEIESDDCMRVTTALGGGELGEGVFERIGDEELCPYQNPRSTLNISRELSQALGIETEDVQSGDKPLYLFVRIEFLSSSSDCDETCEISAAKDASIDEIDIQSDYDR